MAAKYSRHGLFTKAAASVVAPLAHEAADKGMKALLRDPHFWAPAVAMGGGLAAGGIGALFGKAMDKRRKETGYHEMLGLHPDLKGRDAALVRRVYNSLYNVNPTMARDPMVSGAWVGTVLESGGLDPTMTGRALLEGVKDLAGIRAQISRARSEEAREGFGVRPAVTKMVEQGFTRAKELVKERQDDTDREIKRLEGELKTLDRFNTVMEGAQRRGLSRDEVLGELSAERSRRNQLLEAIHKRRP
jgi:hypothetical protein